MIIFTLFITLLTAAYVALFIAYGKGWAKQQEFRLPVSFEPITFISVIIPARNESGNIGACIDALLVQKYHHQLYEIIVVDDHSTDGTADIVRGYADSRVQCIALADFIMPGEKMNSYKKAAIAAGISKSGGELIVTTDADCVAPNAWLRNLACVFEQQAPSMIVGPVIYNSTGGLLPVFQLIDFMGMQGVTAASHSLKLGNMCNGANLAFTREAFNKVNGYEGIDKLASGDDYLLMTKIAKMPGASIAYVKTRHAIVSTSPQPTWGSFLQQRIRWASKSGKYNDRKLTLALLLVYFFNISFPVLAVTGFAWPRYWIYAFIMLLIKTIAEYWFMLPVTAFFHKRWSRVYFPFLQPLHILYIVTAGFLGLVGHYQWKDRKVK
ncbi:MAG: glycosyltransferase [Taibaiella sp.]|nr:glycosyltransferase [Taibaiella sp.]